MSVPHENHRRDRKARKAKMISAISAISAVIVMFGATAYAQRRGGGGGPDRGFFGGFPLRGGGGSNAPILPNAPYDGQFRFIRLRYGPAIAFQTQRVGWSHDYPEGEEHLMKILEELSYLAPHTDQSNVMALDDPDLFHFPVAYLSEPGGWYMTDHEASTFRDYLLKGGFFIVDDFRFQHWDNFEEQMRRILPEAQFFDVNESDPIFHDAFFQIKDLAKMPQNYDPGVPIFRGIYENNDPKQRLMVLINYNTDVSEYWEWSATGLKPVDETNEAYKLGVNYIIYGMTH